MGGIFVPFFLSLSQVVWGKKLKRFNSSRLLKKPAWGMIEGGVPPSRGHRPRILGPS